MISWTEERKRDQFCITRCGPYFGTTVEAVQCLMYQTGWNVGTGNKETQHTLFWGVRKNYFSLSPTYKQSPKNREKSLLVLQFCTWDGSFRHGEMKIWLCLYFQHVTRYNETDFVEERRQEMLRSEKEHFFTKNALTGKRIFQIQRINAVHGRCSSSDVLHDIPSNFTLSVRRRIVLQIWALNSGIDLLPCPNVLSKWADWLGQVHCQYGTFTKLCTSCPCEVEFQVVFFFEGDWCVHKIAVWECFDIGSWTRRISSHVLTR